MEAIDWGNVARRDIESAHSIIQSVHPGVLEKNDDGFQSWWKVGLNQALALAERANSADRALAALRFYIAGYGDGHLTLLGGTYASRPFKWAGWTAQSRGGQLVVTDSAPKWKTEIPPLGARLLECDGVEAVSFLSQRLAPFIDRRLNLDATLSTLAIRLTNVWPDAPLWDKPHVSSCLLRDGAGKSKRYKLHWEDSDEGIRHVNRPLPGSGMEDLGDGRYWIRLSSFMHSGANPEVLQDLQEQIRGLSLANAVVFDTRGNNGGSSLFGYQLLRALLKDVAPMIATKGRAFWRVSPVALQALESHLDAVERTQARQDPAYLMIESLVMRMRTARQKEEAWVEQDNSIVIEHGREPGLAFSGKLVVLTDQRCASACLDFAEMVRGVAGTVHAGATTSGDTRYLDVADVTLPSGLHMWVPMKVWRGRARGDNEPLVPHFAFAGDMNSTQAVQKWVLKEVLPQARPLGRP